MSGAGPSGAAAAGPACEGLPDDRPVAVDALALPLEEGPHPYHAAHAHRAAENWRHERAARPGLFDGEVALAADVSVRGGRLVARCHLVPYSTFLLWRRAPDCGFHIFAMAVIVPADGGVLVGRMAAGTANAGRIYAPSGSFDRGDLSDGRFDPDRNMRREVGEEVGLDLAAAAAAGHWHALRQGRIVTLVRTFFFAEAGEALLARARAHLAGLADPELEAVALAGPADRDDPDHAPHMRAILDWHFAAG